MRMTCSMDLSDDMSRKVAGSLTGFGGRLECRKCGHRQRVGNKEKIANHLLHGWPECCGEVMEWITASQLDAKGNRI